MMIHHGRKNQTSAAKQTKVSGRGAFCMVCTYWSRTYVFTKTHADLRSLFFGQLQHQPERSMSLGSGGQSEPWKKPQIKRVFGRSLP